MMLKILGLFLSVVLVVIGIRTCQVAENSQQYDNTRINQSGGVTAGYVENVNINQTINQTINKSTPHAPETQNLPQTNMPKEIKDTQIIPYFIGHTGNNILNTIFIDGKGGSYLSPDNFWTIFKNDQRDKNHESSSSKKIDFLSHGRDLTEFIILNHLTHYFNKGWYIKDHMDIAIESSDKRVGFEKNVFDKAKKYTVVTKEDIELKFDNNAFINQFAMLGSDIYLPPGANIYSENNKIIIKKDRFFKLIIRTMSISSTGGLSFLEDYFKPTVKGGGDTYLVPIEYNVEFARLAKDNPEMENYIKWAGDVIKLLKDTISDRDDLKQKYIEYKILYPNKKYGQ